MKIEFSYIDRYYYCDNQRIFGIEENISEEKAIENYLRICKKINTFRNIDDDILLEYMYIKKVDKPTTYPKFTNEIPFKLKWNKGFIKQPIIKKIRWNGYNWEYQLENIGHVYSYQLENKLEKI